MSLSTLRPRWGQPGPPGEEKRPRWGQPGPPGEEKRPRWGQPGPPGLSMKEYPNKLYHRVPPWVEPGSVFHIRIRSAFADKRQLVESDLASRIIESVDYYTKRQKWFHHLFVIMPDHIHALLSFSRERSVSQVIGEWKRYHSRVNNVIWQDNYFDHRIRNVDSLIKKASYIRMNPVRAGLCQAPEEWLWVVDQKDSMNN